MWRFQSRQARLAWIYTQSIQAIYDNLQSLTVRITVCSCWCWFLRSNTRIGSFKQCNGNKLRGVKTTGVPFKFSSFTRLVLPTANAAIQTCQRRQNVPYIPCGRKRCAHTPSIKKKKKKKPGHWTVTWRLSHTISTRNVTRKSIKNSIEDGFSLSSADTASEKTRQEGCQLCH